MQLNLFDRCGFFFRCFGELGNAATDTGVGRVNIVKEDLLRLMALGGYSRRRWKLD